MVYLYRIFLFFVGFLLLFVYVQIIQASVVLNEVAIQPNQVVELYNNASTSADISSWYIDDAGGTTYYTVPSQTILPPFSCLLFVADFNFNKSSSDIVRLFDSINTPITSSAKLIESYSYLKAPEIGYSFVKKRDGEDEWYTTTSSLGLFNESLVSCLPSPTPTPLPTETPTPIPTIPPTPTVEPTPLPSPTPEVDYQNIFISEVYPYPGSNEHEWVELYNGNNIHVDLENWYIDDGENGGSTPKLFMLKMDPYTYGVIEFTSSLFNNNKDSVRLLKHSKDEKDSMEYEKISQGKSIGRVSFDEEIYCEQEPSKNAVNFSCLLEPALINLSENKENKLADTVIKTNPSIQKQIIQVQRANTKIFDVYPRKSSIEKQDGTVLGVQTKEAIPASSVSHLSFVSFSYSLLTIVSVFIKIKNA